MEGEDKARRDVDEYLSKIRKHVAEANALVEQAELRMAETDRLLASQGLTREQVLNFRFTKEQRLAANEELARLGLPPMEDDERAYDFDAAVADVRAASTDVEEGGQGDIVEERRRKFDNFMQQYRL